MWRGVERGRGVVDANGAARRAGIQKDGIIRGVGTQRVGALAQIKSAISALTTPATELTLVIQVRLTPPRPSASVVRSGSVESC